MPVNGDRVKFYQAMINDPRGLPFSEAVVVKYKDAVDESGAIGAGVFVRFQPIIKWRPIGKHYTLGTKPPLQRTSRVRGSGEKSLNQDRTTLGHQGST